MITIARMSDAVLRRMLKTVDGGACAPPDACTNCVNTKSPCENGRIRHYYTQKRYNCAGQCATVRVCRIEAGRLC